MQAVGDSGFTRVTQTQSQDLPRAQRSQLPSGLRQAKEKEIAAAAKREKEAASAVKREENRLAAESNPLRQARLGGAFTAGPMLGTDAWSLNLELFYGKGGFEAGMGVMFLPGISLDHLFVDYDPSYNDSLYLKSEPNTSAVSINILGGYSFIGMLGSRNWLLNASFGLEFFLASASLPKQDNENAKPDTEGLKDDFMLIPYLQARFDIQLMATFYFRLGYRLELYTDLDKFFSYYESDSPKANGSIKLVDTIFFGLAMIL
jgi:hypothetical protein